MPARGFVGPGVGFGGPVGFGGLGAGGGCGVGIGIGWGQGAAIGSKYFIIEPEFEKEKRQPRWLVDLQDLLRANKFPKTS